MERKRLGPKTIANFRQDLRKTMAQRGSSTTLLDIELEMLLQTHEHQQLVKLDQIRFVIKLGPVLGLMGTLIPMGISQAALGTGQYSQHGRQHSYRLYRNSNRLRVIGNCLPARFSKKTMVTHRFCPITPSC